MSQPVSLIALQLFSFMLLPVLFIITLSAVPADANTTGLPGTPPMFSLFKKADPIEKFWEWFKTNEARLKNFESDPDRYLNELIAQARKIKPGLVIELEPPKAGVINMTISADGDRELFSAVQSVVDKAPVISGWKFFAFRQRVDISVAKDLTFRLGNLVLNPDEMKFAPVVEGDTLDVIVYVKGLTEDNYNEIAYGGLVLLDNILGEYDCVTKVRSYDFHAMPEQPAEMKDLLPLTELPAYVDNFHKTETR